MSDLQALFEAVRENCSRSSWSKGVELARGGYVTGERDEGEQVVVRVSAAGALVSRTVTLYLTDEDWSCDCGSHAAACEHVAAAAIAVRHARQAGEALPRAPSSVARLRYLLSRAQGALLFERVFVLDDKTEPLGASLAAISSGRAKGPVFVASPADLEVERLLGVGEVRWLPRELMARLIDALCEVGDVRLDGAPVKLSLERVGLVAVVEDDGPNVRLCLKQDPSIDELFSNGVARCGDTLKVVAEPRLTARELEELRAGRSFGPAQLGTLSAELIPSLEARLPVQLRSRRLLPRASRVPARIAFDLLHEAQTLSVLPTLVYGDPPLARLDAGRLVLLGKAAPVRDEEAEERLVRRLQSELGLSPGVRERFVGEQAVALARRLEVWGALAKNPQAAAAFALAAPLQPRLSAGGGGFELEFRSEAGGPEGRGGRADAASVLRAFREGASLVPLLEGGWAPLPQDWLARFGDRIADLLAAKEGREELPASALPDLARLCEELGEPPPPSFLKLKPLLEGFNGLPQVELPADLAASLRPYQRDGVRWLAFLRRAGLGGLLADDMGLGKTLQALCALEPPALVVAPTSVVFNWAQEAERFRPGLRCAIYHGPDRRLDPGADLTLTSYALLRLDLDRLAERRWRTLVLDEAQTIKNPDSQVARAAFRLSADFRVALTGTPVENRLEELWSEMHFLDPGLLGSRQDFARRYAGPIAEGQPAVASRLRERLRPFLLRRLKREVAPELPPRTEVVLRCLLGEEERTVYEALRAATRSDVVARLAGGGSVLEALEALLRLRQACCHPSLVPGQSAKDSAKLELLLENLVEAAADGHKSLVFSQWTSLLDLLEPKLAEAGLAFTRLDGSTRDRETPVRAFQDEAGPPVMLLSLKAGGFGLNLTAADHVFLLDPWWNPATEAQAADRAHRIGQDKPVFVHRLVAIDTVEEKILALQERKRALADAALLGAGAAATLSREDLLALLD